MAKYKGKNLFYEGNIQAKSLKKEVNVVSDYIPKVTMMDWKGYSTNKPQALVFFYDENKKFISSGLFKDFLDLSLSEPDNTGFMRIQNL